MTTHANEMPGMRRAVRPPRATCVLGARALARAQAHIERHLFCVVRLAGVSRAAGLSQHHFSRCFTRSMGVTFVEYVARRRVEAARQALDRNPDADLAALAVEIGFCDQAHLSNVFRRVVGTTPRKYARRSSEQPIDARGGGHPSPRRAVEHVG